MDEDMDCPHIVEAAEKLNVDVEQMRATLSNRSCNVCVRVDQLWICMECKQIFCGHNALGHSTAHFMYYKNHCIFLNIESAAIFCYKCDSEVEPKNHDDELNRLRQFILYNRGPSKNSLKKRIRQKLSKIKPKKTYFKRGSKANKKVCTTDNGNECFMNAALQTLGEQEHQDVSKKLPKTIIKKKAILPKKIVKAIKPKKASCKRGIRTNKKVGLSNSGNNCFMNSVWQALRHLKPFMYCLKLFKASELNKNNNNSEPRNHNFIIAEELLKLLISLVEWQKPAGYKYRDAISPSVLHSIVCKIKPRYKGFHQHDAHEFLMFTLDTLHSELRDEKNRLLLEEGIIHENPNKIDTLVSIMFHGFLLSEVFCLNCNTPSRTNDPFTDISLDVPDLKKIDDPLEPRPVELLTDCLARYIEVEELNEKNFYFCSKCESEQRSTKRFWINILPNILCLHLKRFRWDTSCRTKVHTHIKFPLSSLDMSQYLDNEMKKTMTRETTYLFDLVAVLVHDGEGGGSGHYTTYCLDDNEGQWYAFNDDKVYEVETSMVENAQAYVLIYIKREMKLNLSF